MKARLAYLVAGGIGWYVILAGPVFPWVPGWVRLLLLVGGIGLFVCNQKAVARDVEWWIDRIMGERGNIVWNTWERRRDRVGNWVVAPFIVWFLPLVLGIGAMFFRW